MVIGIVSLGKRRGFEKYITLLMLWIDNKEEVV
jgi:hypothetical protein